MRVFIGGIRTETNTFATRLTGDEDFRKGDVTSASSPHVDPGLHPGYAGFLAAAEKAKWRVARGAVAYAVPGGPVEQAVYERLKNTLLEELRAAGPCDMALLDLHGAMVAERCDDCEGEILSAYRDILGDKAVIGALLDPHAVVTREMVQAADILHAYKEYPHTDVTERAEELFERCAMMAISGARPKPAIAECGLIGGFPTVEEPMKGFVRWMKDMERRPGVLSVSLIQSFPWCDVPAAGAKLLVYADDGKTAEMLAREGGERFRAIFEEAVMKPLDCEAAARIVSANPQKRYILADVSDNPGGGATGDATHLLRALISEGVSNIGVGLLYDPETLEAAWRAGVGGIEEFCLGGKQSRYSGASIVAPGVVKALADNDGEGGRGAVGGPSSGPLALISTKFGEIVVGRERRQALSPSLFTALGANPHDYRVLVLKSSAHFRAAYADFDHEILEAGSPTAMNTDLAALPFCKIRRPVWPLDPLPPLALWKE